MAHVIVSSQELEPGELFRVLCVFILSFVFFCFVFAVCFFVFVITEHKNTLKIRKRQYV